MIFVAGLARWLPLWKFERPAPLLTLASPRETFVPHVLVVDDSPIDRILAGNMLLKEPGMTVSYAVDGADAMEQIQSQLPDAVVSDLQMPEMDGLQLVAAIKQRYPLLPVILMTAQGSEEIAAEALRLGAASYVPKPSLAKYLGDVVGRIISSAGADRGHSRLMNSLSECHCRFTLQNDPELIEPLVNRLQEMLRCLPLADESERLRVGIALKHALHTAYYLGNLELPSDTEDLFSPPMRQLSQERSADARYAPRNLVVEARLSPEQAEFCVRHEGPGIDVTGWPPSLDLTQASSHLIRGWNLMRSIMDDAQFTPDGRTQILVKRALQESEFVFDE